MAMLDARADHLRTIEHPVARPLDRQLSDLPIVSAGAALEPGGVYLDLNNPTHGPFRALAGQVAGLGNRYVAERDIPCHDWRAIVQHAAGVAIAHLEPCDDRPAVASDAPGDAVAMLAPLMSPL